MNWKFWSKKKPEIRWATVICSKCNKEYKAPTSGNPDGVSICYHCGMIDFPFEPYCPAPDGTRYTPDEWDEKFGEKEKK